MTERDKRKTSEDLLREAKEGLAGSYETPSLPSDEAEEPDPLVRPSDRIASGPRDSPPPPPPRPQSAPRPEPRRRRVADSSLPPATLPSETIETASVAKPPRTGLGRLVRIFAFLIIGIMGLLWWALVASIVEDPAEADDLIVGGAVITAFLLVVTIALGLLSNRLRVKEQPGSTGLPMSASLPQNQAPSSDTGTVPTSRGSGTTVVSYLQAGETVLGQATGVRPGASSADRLRSNRGLIGLVIAGAILAVYFGGFFILLLIGAIVSRIFRSSSRQRQSDDPLMTTLVVTDRRLLAFERRWFASGPISPWFAYPLDAVVSQSITEVDNRPAIALTFNDGRTLAAVLSTSDAVAMASALRTAGL